MVHDSRTARHHHTRRDILAGAGALTAFIAAAPARALEIGLKRAVEQACRRAVASQRAFYQTPGASAAVILPNGALITAVNGFADPEAGLPVAPQTRFMSGSTGKTFCAATVMALVEAGRITLDQKTHEIFPDDEWYLRLPNARRLTIRHLLTHQGGFPQFLSLPAFQFAYLADALRGRERAYSPHRMLSFIADRAPLFAAGEGFSYSDLHYHLLGLVIERIAGAGYYDALSTNILSKMPRFSAEITPADTRAIDRLAAGYAKGDILARLSGVNGRSTDENGRLRNDPSLEYTGGGLAVTPRSLAEFYWRLARGEIVSAHSFAEMVGSTVAQATNNPAIETGYGLGFYVTRRDGFGTYVSHSGYYPGYTSNVACFLDYGFAVAIQQNSDHGPDLFQRVRDIAAATIAELQR